MGNRARIRLSRLSSTTVALLAVGLVSLGTMGNWAIGIARADTAFPQTGYVLYGPFEQYWKSHGGLAQFGMPRTGGYHAGKDYDAQWFERALFTYNPSQPEEYKVELDLLGAQSTTARKSEAAFAPAKAGSATTYFPATGHNLSGKFLDYWQKTGGLPIY